MQASAAALVVSVGILLLIALASGTAGKILAAWEAARTGGLFAKTTAPGSSIVAGR